MSPSQRRISCALLILVEVVVLVARGIGQTPDAPLRRYTGDYRTEDGAIVSVFTGAPGGGTLVLAFLDWRSRRYGVLHPDTLPHEFFAGPGLAGRSPVEVRASFEDPGRGRAGRLVLSYVNGPDKRARRVPTYRREEILVAHDEVRLPGWLLLPEHRGPHPAIVLAHGGGTVTRRDLIPTALFFVHQGFATLIYDKRGSGQARGPAWHWFDPLAADVVRALEILALRADVDPARIGVWGASEGGWIAPIAADRSSHVSFVLLHAAPATSPQRRAEAAIGPKLRADGFADPEIGEARRFVRSLGAFYSGDGDALSYRAALAEARREPWFSYVAAPADLESLRRFPDRLHAASRTIRSVGVPVLALYGGLDTIVPADVHAPLMYDALRGGDNPDFTVVVYPRATHSIAEGETGGRKEAPRLNRFVSGFWGSIASWLELRELSEPMDCVPGWRVGACEVR